MTEQYYTNNIYAQVLNELEKFRPQLEEAFNQRSEGNIKINADKYSDLINDFGIIVSIDIENAHRWFAPDNQIIASKYDLRSLAFQDFYEIFSDWLYFESEGGENKPSGDGVIRMSTKELINKPIESKPNQEEFHQPKIISQNFGPKKQTTILPLNYRKNKRKIDEALLLHIQEVQDKFNTKALKIEEERIDYDDLFKFIKDTFEICELELVENPDDSQNFFEKPTSSKTFYNKVEMYLTESLQLNQCILLAQEMLSQTQNIKLTFTECFGIIDYWFKNDEDVVVYNKNERKAQNEENPIHTTLKKTILNYEKLLNTCSNTQEKEILSNTIDALKKQLDALNKANDTQNLLAVNAGKLPVQGNLGGGLKKEDKKKKALLDIYHFYCKMQANIGKSTTFEKIESEMTSLNLGNMSMICKDFSLFNKKFDSHKMVEIFKKNSSSTKDLTLDEFERVLEKIALKHYQDDINLANDLDKIEALYEHIGIYNGEYKRKLHSRVLPFHSFDKESFRSGPNSLEYKFKYKPHSGKTAEEIKEEIKRRQQMRELAKKQKIEKPKIMQNTPDVYSDLKKLETKGGSYVGINDIKNKIITNPEKNKLTLEKLEHMHYEDIKGYNEKFDPADLIDYDDDEDQFYLAEYNLNTDKSTKDRGDQYGNMKARSKSPLGYSQIHESRANLSEASGRNGYVQGYQNYSNSKDGARASNAMVKKYLLPESTSAQHSKQISYQMSTNPSNTDINSGINPTIIGGKIYGKNGAQRGYISSQILERADEIDQENRLKEQQRMKNALMMQDNQIRKGMNALSRIK